MMISGVYVVFHATKPRHVYVGEAADCALRNKERKLLGLKWLVAKAMRGSTQNERRIAERAIADSFVARGYTVLSKNTTAAVEATRLARVGKTPPPHVIEMLRAQSTGRKHTPATRRKMQESAKARVALFGMPSMKGRSHSEATKQKIREAKLGRRHTYKTKQKMSRGQRAAWRRRVEN